MTEEQKASLQYAAEWLFRSEDISNRKHAERLRALLAAGASEGQAEEFPEVEQDWAQVEPSVAFHLIERHAENWAHAGHLMEAWRSATTSAEIAALRERIAGMEKDAERYRFIKSKTKTFSLDMGGNHTYVMDYSIARLRGPSLDRAIDAAIAKEKQG